MDTFVMETAGSAGFTMKWCGAYRLKTSSREATVRLYALRKNEVRERGKEKEERVSCCEEKWPPFTHRTEQWGARAYSEAVRFSWEAKVVTKEKKNKNNAMLQIATRCFLGTALRTLIFMPSLPGALWFFRVRIMEEILFGEIGENLGSLKG